MTSTFRMYYIAVVNSDLVNCKTSYVEKGNMPNITKNSVKPQKSALKLIRGTLLSSYVFSIFLVFINFFSNNTTVAIKPCSRIRFKVIIQESFSYFLIFDAA